MKSRALSQHILRRLGLAAVSPSLLGVLGPWSEPDAFDRLPAHAFRTMSEDHFQRSWREGVHQSDERCNYIGQGSSDESEGTAAGRWAYPGFLPNSPNGVGRIVKIAICAGDGWEEHPHDDYGYVRTFEPIPVERFVAWTDPIDSRGCLSVQRWRWARRPLPAARVRQA